MNIDSLTLGEIKQLREIFNVSEKTEGEMNEQVGTYVIVRTYAAGNWFGKLTKKSGNEIYLEEARRLYRWWAEKSVSLSGVALYGIKYEDSKICAPLKHKLWLEAIEIISLSDEIIEHLKNAPEAKAE
jgi:hypothetical protein